MSSKVLKHTACLGLIVMFVLTLRAHGQALQTTGTPCSPSATTTVDGRYLPNLPAPFGGTINLSAKDSKPCWPSDCCSTTGCAKHSAHYD